MQLVKYSEHKLLIGKKPSRTAYFICVVVSTIGLILLWGGLRFDASGYAPASADLTYALQTGQGLQKLVLAIGGVCAAVGLLLPFAIRPQVICSFDANSGIMTLTHSAQHKTCQPLAAIAAVQVEEWAETYRIKLILTSGVDLPLTCLYTSGQKEKQQIAEAIRCFLNLRNSL
jgi:hypothetical protein